MNTLDTRNLKVIDLSHPIHTLREPVSPEEIVRGVLEEEMVWPIETFDSYIDDSVCQYVKLKTHVKTHIESPWHLNKKGRCLSDFPLSHFIGRMVNFCFDLPKGALITREILAQYDAGDLRHGDIVVFHSTLGEHRDDSGIPPVLTPDAAIYLIDKGIKMFGQDNSIISWNVIDGKRPHDMLLSAGIPLLEMLANTQQLMQKVSFIIAIPGLIKILGLDASTVPVVVIEGLNVE